MSDDHETEIIIEIDYHETELMGAWFTAFVMRHAYNPECLWYGLCYRTYEDAEQAARDYLRELV